MPVSSAEIAQMAMQNYQQVALMGSMYSGYGSPDRMAGHAMNAVGSIGSGAMDMMKGIPMALGMQAGMSAFGAGAGLTGALGAGMGVAGATAIPIGMGAAAFGYAGHQMMQGAQDQQQLNATLAGSFRHYNQQGGRGFGRGEMSSIGGAMREMSHEVGQGGELTSMRELTELAGKMGQMGMGRGIKDAKEFNTKFRELVKTVKEVATELNTSLSQAMEFMGAAKSSGVFGKTSQAQFAGLVRNTAVSSNLATSEVTSMANIGSQISRSFGGLGRQGAIGGMKAIGDVGAAMQAGVMSEEDVYNATGMAGAEGRQAMASNMMAQSGSFLKSGKGRWFLASVAGRDGTLDEEDAARYMRGGLGVGDTRGMAHKNLGEVGRANFIRNEGRLRGAAMEKFGGMIPAMALMGWASQKGVDINDMDDRSMLFAQRQLGMGRDELDQAVKMASNMPAIARQQAGARQDADNAQRLGLDLKHKGVEGLKRRFEHAKEGINSKLKQAGQDIYSETVEYVEKYMNELLDHTVTATTANLGEIYRSSLLGGSSGRNQAAAVFGIGSIGGKGLNKQLAEGLGSKAPVGAASRSMSWDEFAGKGGIGGALAGSGRYKEQFEKAGFSFSDIEGMGPGQQRDAAMNSRIAGLSQVQKALAGGAGSMGMSSNAQKTLLDIYSSGGIAGEKTGSRVAALRSALADKASSGDKGAQELLKKFDGATDAQAMFLTAQAENSIGMSGNSIQKSFEGIGDTAGMLSGRGRYRTVEEADRAVGRSLTGRKQIPEGTGLFGSVAGGAIAGTGLGIGVGGAIGGMVGAGIGIGVGLNAWSSQEGKGLGSKIFSGAVTGGMIGSASVNPFAVIGGAVLGGALAARGWYGEGGGAESKRAEEEAGRELRSEESMRHGAAIMGNDATARADSVTALQRKVISADRNKDKMLKDGSAITAATLLMMNSYRDKLTAGNGKVSGEDQEALVAEAKRNGLNVGSYEDLVGRLQDGYQGIQNKQIENYDAQIAATRRSKSGEVDKALRTGMLTRGEGGALALTEASSAKMSASTREMMGGYVARSNKWEEAQRLRASSPEESAKLEHEVLVADGRRLEVLSRKSVQELKGLEREGGSTDLADDAAYMRSGIDRVKSLTKGGRGRAGGKGAAAAALLGINADKKTRERLNQALTTGTDAEALEQLAESAGLTGAARNQFVNESAESKKLVSSMRGGKSGEAFLASQQLRQGDGDVAKALRESDERKKGPQEKSADYLKNIEKGITTLNTAFTNFAPSIAAEISKVVSGEAAQSKAPAKS